MEKSAFLLPSRSPLLDHTEYQVTIKGERTGGARESRRRAFVTCNILLHFYYQHFPFSLGKETQNVSAIKRDGQKTILKRPETGEGRFFTIVMKLRNSSVISKSRVMTGSVCLSPARSIFQRPSRPSSRVRPRY